MFRSNAIHAIAAARGDGLRPEFLALIDRIEAESAVADIARHRGDVQIQAGPNPTGMAGGRCRTASSASRRPPAKPF